MNVPVASLMLVAMLMLPAASAGAQSDVLFPPATPGCYVGAETASANGAAPKGKSAVGVTAVRLERSYPQLAHEEEKQARPAGGDRLINLRVIVTFADAGKKGATKRYANGPNDLLRCSSDTCDGGNYQVERQADGTVLLRMTGGLNVGGGGYREKASRQLPDGRIYRLAASPMSACR